MRYAVRLREDQEQADFCVDKARDEALCFAVYGPLRRTTYAQSDSALIMPSSTAIATASSSSFAMPIASLPVAM